MQIGDEMYRQMYRGTKSGLPAGVEEATTHGSTSMLLFGLLATFALSFAVWRRASKPVSTREGGRAYAPWVVLLLGAVLSLAVYLLLDKTHRAKERLRFDATLVDYGKTLERGLSDYLDTLYHIRSALAVSPRISREEFHRLTRWDRIL